MNRSLNNILFASTLMLTFAPILDCKNTQTSRKISSAINYVKNTHTPLTAKQQLAQYIAQADVIEFKNTYNSFQKWPTKQRVATLQPLIKTAQEIKQALQEELKNNDSKVTFTTTKGITQIIIGTILLIQDTAFSHGLYKSITDDWSEDSLSFQLLNTKLFGNIVNIYFNVLYKIFGEDDDGNVNASINTSKAIHTTYALATLAISAYAIKSGVQNCKNDWNYRAHLVQKIKNIDEINAFIQAQLK